MDIATIKFYYRQKLSDGSIVAVKRIGMNLATKEFLRSKTFETEVKI